MKCIAIYCAPLYTTDRPTHRVIRASVKQQRHQDTVALVQVQQPVVVRGELGQRAVHGDGGGPVAGAARLEEGSHLETNRGVSVMNMTGWE